MRRRAQICKPCFGSLCFIVLFLLAAPAASQGAHHRRHHAKGDHLKPGQVVMSYGEGNQACAVALGRYPRSAWSHPQSLPPDDHGAVAINLVEGEGPLLDDGTIALSCGHGVFSKTTTIVGYDIFARRILWAKPVAGADAYAVTQHHLLAVVKHKTPPKGLQGSSTSWSLLAFGLKTGRREWIAPFPAESPGEGFWGVWEGPLAPGAPESILLQYKGTQAYSTTGQLLWHTGLVVPGYVGYGISEEDTHKEATFGELTRIAGPQDGITAFNVQTGEVAWQETLPQACELGASTDFGPSELVGSVLWSHGKWDDEEGHGGYCVVGHDVTTGQVVTDTLFPDEVGEAIWADHEHLIAWGHGTLAGWSTTDASHPLWSEPAGETGPLAISGSHAAVGAPSGLLIISTATGKVEGHVPKDFLAEEGNNVAVTDGLLGNYLQYGEIEIVDLDRR